MTRCIYCSAPCHGKACQWHKDLLRLDPHYMTAWQGSHRQVESPARQEVKA